MPCYPVEDLLRGIAENKYQEKPLIQGRMSDKTLRWYVNTETNSWTLIFLAGNIGCILGSGYGFETLGNDLVGKPS